MMKKRRSPISIVNESATAKKDTLVLDEYFCLQKMQGKPVTQEFIDATTVKLLEWASFDTSLKMQQFYSTIHMTKSDFYRIKNRCKKLQKVYEFVLNEIGCRRELGALTRKFDPSTILKNLYLYDDEWKDVMEYHAALTRRREEEKNSGQIIVGIPVHTAEPDWKEQWAREVARIEKRKAKQEEKNDL
jgi:hypothetical protein